VAVERDDEMADEIERRYLSPGAPGLGPARLEIIRDDILAVSLRSIARARGADRVRVIGNIPYRITSPLLHWFTAEIASVTMGVFTMQREVAERLLAEPGNKAYGSLTLAVMRRARVERVMHLSAGAFRPAPKVRSTVVRLVPNERPAVDVPDEALLETIIRKSFNQRRKMLRRSLVDEGTWKSVDVKTAALRAGIALERRPEELSLADFGRLATALWELGYRSQGNPEQGSPQC
jgi:16S rRNA (adenine1518-N6/adenine1519-N6)-dimethyltransferase